MSKIDQNHVEIVRNSAFFQPDFYLAQLADAGLQGLDPAAHYLLYGAIERRDPGPDFSTLAYLGDNVDVAILGINPLFHYEVYGRHEGRVVRPSSVRLQRARASQGVDVGAGRRKRAAILHIGTEKTGTTFIQRFLWQNREQFPQQGVFIPSAGRIAPLMAQYTSLPLLCGAPERISDLVPRGRQLDEMRRRFEDEIAFEMDSLPQSIDTVVFSSEHLHSRIKNKDEISQLKSFLDRFFESYRIIVYLRRQDEMGVSFYNERLKGGDNPESIFDLTVDNSYYDLYGLLREWSAVFGRDSVHPRLFDRREFPQGELLRDFLDAIGVTPFEGAKLGFQNNPSLNVTGQAVVRAFNSFHQHAATDGGGPDFDELRGRLMDFLTEHYAGRGSQPSQEEARAFYAAFAEDNEKLRAEWFPDHSRLFDDAFDKYPESPENDVALAKLIDPLLEFALHSYRAHLREKNGLRRDLDFLRNSVVEVSLARRRREVEESLKD